MLHTENFCFSEFCFSCFLVLGNSGEDSAALPPSIPKVCIIFYGKSVSCPGS